MWKIFMWLIFNSINFHGSRVPTKIFQCEYFYWNISLVHEIIYDEFCYPHNINKLDDTLEQAKYILADGVAVMQLEIILYSWLFKFFIKDDSWMKCEAIKLKCLCVTSDTFLSNESLLRWRWKHMHDYVYITGSYYYLHSSLFTQYIANF